MSDNQRELLTCARCGFPRVEHHYNGACYGICGEFIEQKGIDVIIIVDLDHTICDAAWRDPLLGKWEEYHAEGQWDRPIEFIREVLLAMKDCEIVAVTARPEWNRQMTVRWLAQHAFPIDTLLMRGLEDHRSSPIVKTDLIKNNFPDLSVISFVMEDRDDCVAAFRQMGLNVLQVYKGADNERRGSNKEIGGHTSTEERALRGGLSEGGPKSDGSLS